MLEKTGNGPKKDNIVELAKKSQKKQGSGKKNIFANKFAERQENLLIAPVNKVNKSRTHIKK